MPTPSRNGRRVGRRGRVGGLRERCSGLEGHSRSSVPLRLTYPRDEDQDHAHQDDRQRGRRRVVLQLQEVRLDDVADHRGVRSAEEAAARVDVVAGRRDEGEQRAGDDAGQRERQRHLEERGPRAGVQVAARLDVAQVEPLERGVDRQAHERDEVVGEAEDDGDRRAGDVGVLRHDVSACRNETTGPSSLRICFQARVRSRNEMKNGAITIVERERLPERVAAQLDADEVRERIAEQQGEDRRDRRVRERPDDVRQVGLHDRDVVLPLERVVVLADVAELAGRLEARQDQGDERDQEEQAEVQRAGQQQEERDRAAPACGRFRGDRRRGGEGAERHLRLPRARLRDARDAGWRSARCPRRVRSAERRPGRRRGRSRGRRSR